jgi:hypothetical protein
MSRAGIGSAGGRRYSSEADQIQSYIRTEEQPGGWLYRQDVAQRATIKMQSAKSGVSRESAYLPLRLHASG